MNYQFLWRFLSLSIIILRASAGSSFSIGNIDNQVNSGYDNVEFQANTNGDFRGWVTAEGGAQDNSEGPVQAQFHDDGQAYPFLVSDVEPCSIYHGTADIQDGSNGLTSHDKGGAACKIDSPPTMQQIKKRPAGANEDIPDPMPRWPTLQLKPNRQMCDHDIYNVPACAKKEGAKFVSLFLYDLPVCLPQSWETRYGILMSFGAIVICPDLFDPVFEGPCGDPEELIWCCQLLVPTWLEPTMHWSYAGVNCALQTNLPLV